MPSAPKFSYQKWFKKNQLKIFIEKLRVFIFSHKLFILTIFLGIAFITASFNISLPNINLPVNLANFLPKPNINLPLVKQKNIETGSAIVSQDLYNLTAKSQKLKNLLANNSQPNEQQIAEILQYEPIIASQISQTGSKYQVTTNAEGYFIAPLQKGIYQLSVAALENYDFTNLPDKIFLEEKPVSLLLGIKPGKGRVLKRKGAFSSDPFLFLPQSKAPEKQQNLAVTLFNDKNNNKKLDEDEKIVPWAGVAVVLEKQEEQGFGKIIR